MARAIVVVKRFTKIDTIEVDSCLEETHDLSNTVTDHPVEDGSAMSDHSQPDPDRVTLRCFVSNIPFSKESTSRTVERNDFKWTTSAPEEVPLGQTDGRGDTAYKELVRLRLAGQLIQVITTLKTYGVTADGGLMIERISIPRTRENFDGLEWSMQLKEVKIARSKRTSETKAKDRRARPKKKEGAKTPQEPAKKVTALKQLYRAGGGTR